MKLLFSGVRNIKYRFGSENSTVGYLQKRGELFRNGCSVSCGALVGVGSEGELLEGECRRTQE